MRRWCLVIAAAITAAYLALRLTGQVRYVSVLSGTSPEGVSGPLANAWAAAYVALHLAFVAAVPALLLAAALDFAVDRWLARRPPERGP
ncbi:MAG: hypothetical protein U0324_04435 [Polyangiales bacterium]